MESRDRVYEHRITSQVFGAYQVRWWIEAAEEHGGIGALDAAKKAAKRAEDPLFYPDGWDELPLQEIAAMLLDALPAANSVEVVHEPTGDGCAAHRDWP